jgi:hypothetical protein
MRGDDVRIRGLQIRFRLCVDIGTVESKADGPWEAFDALKQVIGVLKWEYQAIRLDMDGGLEDLLVHGDVFS